MSIATSSPASRTSKRPKLCGALGEEVRQTVRVVPPQDSVDGARVQFEVRPEQIRTPAQLQAQPEDRRFDGIRGAPWRAVRPRASILVRTPATAPAVHRSPARAVVAGRARPTDSSGLIHEERSRAWRKACGTVHRSPSDFGVGRTPPP
jgi:hypothetical protein